MAVHEVAKLPLTKVLNMPSRRIGQRLASEIKPFTATSVVTGWGLGRQGSADDPGPG